MAHTEVVGYRRSAIGMTSRRGWKRRAPWALAVCASLLLVGMPTPASAWGPAKEAGLLREADGHRKKGEHRQAGEKYAAYYRAQPESQRASSAGAYVVDFAVSSYLASFEASSEPADLEASKALLDEFLADVERVHGSADQPFAADAKTKRETVEAKLAELTPTSTKQPEPEPESESESESGSESGSESESESDSDPDPDPDPDPVVDRSPPPGPDKLGIGLVVGGSVVVLGGIGMLIGGSQYMSIAEDRLRETEAMAAGSDFQPDRDAYLDNARKARNVMLGLGAAVVAVGLVPTIWGAVRLARHGKRNAKASARVGIGPSAGLTLHGTF
jgi:hypothetical protein